MYTIQKLSEMLIFIQWASSPRASDFAVEDQFIRDLRQALDEATRPTFVLSDLRYGRISNMKTLQRMADLTRHPNYAGSTAFSSHPVTNILVSTFSRFSIEEKPQDAIWKTPEEALAYLESLEKGVTSDIDWNQLLKASPANR